MPVVQVSHAPSRAEYEKVSEHLALGDERPEGLIVHAASETAAGEVEIVDVWESAEALQRFAQERLFPAFEAAGVAEQAMQGERPTAYEPFDYVTGS